MPEFMPYGEANEIKEIPPHFIVGTAVRSHPEFTFPSHQLSLAEWSLRQCMANLFVPSLQAHAKTARIIEAALARRGTTFTHSLNPSNPAGDVYGVTTKAVDSNVDVIAGYSLGAYVALRALVRKPHLECDGIWFSPALDSDALLRPEGVPQALLQKLRPHHAYLEAHLQRFQPGNLVPLLARLRGCHRFIFGRNDDTPGIRETMARIADLDMKNITVHEIEGGHFFDPSAVESAVSRLGLRPAANP